LGKIPVVSPRRTAVRSTLEENREFAFSVGQKDVAAKSNAIAHFNGNAALDLDRIIFGGKKGSS
jgi:hypothetical protein